MNKHKCLDIVSPNAYKYLNCLYEAPVLDFFTIHIFLLILCFHVFLSIVILIILIEIIVKLGLTQHYYYCLFSLPGDKSCGYHLPNLTIHSIFYNYCLWANSCPSLNLIWVVIKMVVHATQVNVKKPPQSHNTTWITFNFNFYDALIRWYIIRLLHSHHTSFRSPLDKSFSSASSLLYVIPIPKHQLRNDLIRIYSTRSQ